MKTMRALRLMEWGKPPKMDEVPVPEPGPGEVVVKVAAAGACHSDLHLMDWPPGMLPWKLPFTLGHEVAGHVSGLGPGATGLKEGDPVVVYGPWGCGTCRNCRLGQENYCVRAAQLPGAGVGLGFDGGMADYVVVPDTRLLLDAHGIDPAIAAPLTDAALTPYHAVAQVRQFLVPGAALVVIGAGGLGHAAVQIARALTPATVIVVDKDRTKVQRALTLGAHYGLVSDEGTVDEIRKLTSGTGADAVIDLVGADSTLTLASKVVRSMSHIVLVGLAQGTLPFNFFAVPYGTAISTSYWGTSPELMEVLELARSGLIHITTETFSLQDAAHSYELLRAGRIAGRAVVLPELTDVPGMRQRKAATTTR